MKNNANTMRFKCPAFCATFPTRGSSNDSSGNAAITSADQTPVALTADKLSTLLSGAAAAAVGLPGNTWLQAVRFVSEGRTRVAIVAHGFVTCNTNRGYVEAWLQ